jgi:hypothetical protein
VVLREKFFFYQQLLNIGLLSLSSLPASKPVAESKGKIGAQLPFAFGYWLK